MRREGDLGGGAPTWHSPPALRTAIAPAALRSSFGPRGLAALALATAALGGAGVACSGAPDDPAAPRVGATRSAVIRGTASDASQDAVVLVTLFDRATQGFGQCTGTLLAPNLVLTARHCVARTDEAAACSATGRPLAGGKVYANHPAASLYVFAGPNRPTFRNGMPDPAPVRGLEILDDGATTLCDHDIALLVLQGPVANAPIAPVRLESEPAVGELFTAIGWGVTDRAVSPAVRQQRGGIAILEVGPGREAPPNEFLVGESICSGDSGGPAIAESGAVIGVVSRGGNATQPDPNDPAASCRRGQNLYTKTTPFKELILGAFAVAGAEPWIEGSADPRLAKVGEACAEGAACRSGLCLGEGEGAGTCTDACVEGTCAEGYHCGAEDVCLLGPAPAAPKPKAEPVAAAPSVAAGCGVGPARAPGSGVAAALGLGLGLAALRKRRQQAS